MAALLGLMLSMVGYAEIGAVPRYSFGISYLLDKLPLVPMVLGWMSCAAVAVLGTGPAMALVVPLAVFFAFQRYFVQGLLAGSVK